MQKLTVFQMIFRKVFFRVIEHDAGVYNLETEDGFNLLQEDSSLINL